MTQHGDVAHVRQDVVTAAALRSPRLSAGPDEADTAVVFVHGNPGSSGDYRGLVAAVGEYGRAVAVDMPGFGQADKPRSFAQTIPGHAEHLDALLTVQGISRAHLVLHDFGGPWGLAWAVGHPDKVASVTLLDTGVLPGYRWHWLARVWQTPLVGELVMAATSKSAFRFAVANGYPFKPKPPQLPGTFLDEMARNFDRGTRDAALRLYRACRHFSDMAEVLAMILRHHRFPALVIWGGRDYYLPVAQAELQRTAFPDAKIIVLPGSGHWPMIDNAPAVETAVTEFLRPLLAAGAIPADGPAPAVR